MSEQTRLSILARVQETSSGDSWVEFSEIYEDLIYHWLDRQGVRRQDADDIRQEVMTIVLRKIGGFEHNGRTGAFRSWMRAITANCMREFWRGIKRHHEGGPNLEDIASQLEDESSRQSIIWNTQHDRHVINHLLDQISQRLTEQSVTIFRRVAIGQEDAQDVADDLGMTLGAVRVAQHRVLKAIKEVATGLVDQY
ncbi:MAG: RNA polymerase sigma-70 factor (ECF subfamily) [Mariniblastus sp.]|jgi:RNA polymerase sigma-70 factor (ECF subfamily)